MKAEINKRVFGLFVFGVLMFSMIGFVSAQNEFVEGIQKNGKLVYEILRPILKLIVGDGRGGPDAGEIFLAKILLLIILFTVIWIALGNVDFFKEKTWALWVVSIGVSILGIRYLISEGVIRTIILPYSTLGIVISAGLPFVLFFWIVGNFKSRSLRRTAWVFFAVVFIGLWFTRYGDNQLPGISSFIYWATAIGALLMAKFDGTIARWRNKINAEKGTAYKELEIYNDTKKELEKAIETHVDMIKDGTYSAAKVNAAEKKVKDLKKALAAIAS